MDAYVPVSCDLQDELEALATLHQECQLQYQNDNGEKVEVQGQIADIYASHQADYLKLKDGTEIRLDRIVSVNGKLASDYAANEVE